MNKTKPTIESQPNRRTAFADAEADRDAVLTSAKAQIASSDAALRAGRASIDSTLEAIAEGRRKVAKANEADEGAV